MVITATTVAIVGAVGLLSTALFSRFGKNLNVSRETDNYLSAEDLGLENRGDNGGTIPPVQASEGVSSSADYVGNSAVLGGYTIKGVKTSLPPLNAVRISSHGATLKRSTSKGFQTTYYNGYDSENNKNDDKTTTGVVVGDSVAKTVVGLSFVDKFGAYIALGIMVIF